MFGELIIPILLSMASPEAVEYVPADSEEITQYVCEDDLLAGGEKTLKPSDVKPAEEARMQEKSMPMREKSMPMQEKSMPMRENGMQEKSMPMRENGMQEKSMPMRENGMQEKSMPMHEKRMEDKSMPMHENQQPAEPKEEGRRCSRCGKGHLRQ